MKTRLPYLILLALALALTAPVAATAQMQVGFQSDAQLLDPATRPQALDIIASEGTWTRLMVREEVWAQDAAMYEDAVRAAHAKGLKVMVTLYRWQGYYGTERPPMTAAEVGTFAGTVASRLGPYVDAWSPVNEPDIPAFRVKGITSCRVVSGSSAGVIIRNGRVRTVRYKHARPPRAKYRRVVRVFHTVKRGTWKKITYKRAHGRRAKYRRIVRWRDVGNKTNVATEYDRRMCEANDSLAAYRDAYDLAAMQIRRLDPTAKLVLGELAWTKMDGIRYAYNARPGVPDVDVIGVHTYHDPGANVQWIADTVTFARAHGAVVWATEWGHHCTSPGAWWAQTAQRLQDMGVRMAMAYTLYGGSVSVQQGCEMQAWDTGLLNRNGSARPAWTALTNWN